MVNLYQIVLVEFNEDEEDILHELWETYLKDDKWWHFFYEGTYTVVRVSKPFVKKVTTFMKQKKVTCRKEGKWIDNIQITKRFQKEFMYIFHGYSTLAMKNIKENNERVSLLLDRVIHCFMNNMSQDERRGEHYGMWEPIMIAESAILRAYTIGDILGRSRANKKS